MVYYEYMREQEVVRPKEPIVKTDSLSARISAMYLEFITDFNTQAAVSSLSHTVQSDPADPEVTISTAKGTTREYTHTIVEKSRQKLVYLATGEVHKGSQTDKSPKYQSYQIHFQPSGIASACFGEIVEDGKQFKTIMMALSGIVPTLHVRHVFVLPPNLGVKFLVHSRQYEPSDEDDQVFEWGRDSAQLGYDLSMYRNFNVDRIIPPNSHKEVATINNQFDLFRFGLSGFVAGAVRREGNINTSSILDYNTDGDIVLIHPGGAEVYKMPKKTIPLASLHMGSIPSVL